MNNDKNEKKFGRFFLQNHAAEESKVVAILQSEPALETNNSKKFCRNMKKILSEKS